MLHRGERQTQESNWRATNVDVIPSRLFINSPHNVTGGHSLDKTVIQQSGSLIQPEMCCLFSVQTMMSEHFMPFALCAMGSLMNDKYYGCVLEQCLAMCPAEKTQRQQGILQEFRPALQHRLTGSPVGNLGAKIRDHVRVCWYSLKTPQD